MSGNKPHTPEVDGVSAYPATGQQMQTPPAARQALARQFRRFFSHCIFVWALAPIFFMTGCHTMNDNTADNGRIEPPALTREVPLRFKRHNFGAYCFNTIGCNVIYNHRYQVEEAPEKVSPPPPSNPDYVQAWMGGEADIRNFPPPAQIRWKSLDGVVHEAQVDIGAIFKDELIWHKVPKADMFPFFEGPVAGAPDIFLEVNGRTINVYIGESIPTLTEQRPGHKDSDYRRDNFLAWTRTY